jgi:lauroyl/myristoyl acyltransferase
MNGTLPVYRAVAAVVLRLPLGFCYGLARLLGFALAVLPGSRRDAIRSNLAVVYASDIADHRVRRDTRRALQHAMLNYVDLFRLERPDAARWIQAIHVPSMRPIDAALAEGRGLILISAHLGNFDSVVHKLALRGDRVLVPVEPVQPPGLLTYMTKQRSLFGLQIEPIGPETFKHMSAHLRAGGIVVIVSDRDVQGTGQVVPFFGRPVSLPNAAVLLALRTGAPILGTFGYRHRNNAISAHALPEPLTVEAVGQGRSPRAVVDAAMRRMAAMIEQEIRQDPGQWVVQQPVFSPRGEAAPRAARALWDLGGRVG